MDLFDDCLRARLRSTGAQLNYVRSGYDLRFLAERPATKKDQILLGNIPTDNTSDKNLMRRYTQSEPTPSHSDTVTKTGRQDNHGMNQDLQLLFSFSCQH